MSTSFTSEDLLTALGKCGSSWLPFLETDSLQTGLYRVSNDDQATHRPHAMDEVYYTVSGHGMLRAGAQDHQVSPGTIVFIPKGQEHHFHSIEEELTLLVFFARGAE